MSPANAQQGPGRRSGLPVVLAVIAAVVLFGVAAWFLVPRLVPVGTRSSPSAPATGGQRSPTPSPWDESPSPPPSTPTPSPSRSTQVLPCGLREGVVRGRLYGGLLSMPANSSWDESGPRDLDWAVCPAGIDTVIAQNWVSEVVLSGVHPSRVKGSLQDQAEAIAAQSSVDFYDQSPQSWKIVKGKLITLDGLPAYELWMEVRVTQYGPKIPGDLVDIVVVDTQPGVRSVMLTFVTIGDAKTGKQVDAMRAGLRVEA